MKKRILLSLVSFFAMTAMWASLTEAYQIYVTAGAAGKTGDKATLTLNMKNKEAIATWTCDVVLPAGVTYVDGTVAAVTARYAEEAPAITVSVNEETGVVTFAYAGVAGQVMTNTDGAIATFEVEIAADVEPGDYPVQVKNASMVDGDDGIHGYALREDTWTIEQGEVGVLGDCDGNGVVNALDYQFILNLMGDEAYNVAGDVNKDGKVDGIDAQTVLNIMGDAE